MRPTFHTNDGHEIRAAGITFHTFYENRLYILLILRYDKNWYEDFGGKTDEGDNTIWDTATRETWEESNEMFDIEKLREIVRDRISVTPDSKYLTYHVQQKYIPCPDIVFGNYENEDQLYRSVQWINFNNLQKIKLNPRLRNSTEWFDNLEAIYESYRQQMFDESWGFTC